MKEGLTWAFIALASLAYMGQRKTVEKVQVHEVMGPSAQQEIDPTRWRHNGRQRIRFRSGNGNANAKSFQQELRLYEALAF